MRLSRSISYLSFCSLDGGIGGGNGGGGFKSGRLDSMLVERERERSGWKWEEADIQTGC
jgi:hypothetical protein